MISNTIKDEILDIQNDIERFINLLFDNSEIIKQLNFQLAEIEAEQDDLLHEVELTKNNAFEKQKVYDKLKDVRERRRCIKDRLQIANTIKPLSDTMCKKGIFAESKLTKSNLENLIKTFDTRKYHAKIRKDLKCCGNN